MMFKMEGFGCATFLTRFDMKFTVMVMLTYVTAITFITGDIVPVRLINGTTEFDGIVQVLYNKTWGTVCDDGISNTGCVVVCSQLGFSGGVLVKKASEVYHEVSGQIWLDDVTCTGQEPDLNTCHHLFWGQHDCDHREDIGCKCEPPATFTDQLPTACLNERHRINAFNPRYPGIGRAEVQDDNSQWYTICDDYWDDVDAAVFCKCLGYTDSSHFRAYWSKDLIGMEPVLQTAYDSVQCSVSDLNNIKNIWSCKTKPNTGKCDSKTEAAAVACQAVPTYAPPDPPATNVQCDSHTMRVCYTNDDFYMHKEYMGISPACGTSIVSDIVDGICVEIPLDDCEAEKESIDISAKHYCYSVTYAEPSTADPLITSYMWGRTACCSLAKNGTVVSSFQPFVPESPAIYTDTSVNFTMECFLDDTFGGEPLPFPVNVSRGQEVYCKVSAVTWDPELWLVVPDCKFMPVTTGTPSYQFLDDKCPTSEEFGVHYYSFDGHNWGFKFRTPKFQGYDNLYMVCNCYVCDPTHDSKPYCDRSCTNADRKKRSLDDGHLAQAVTKIAQGPFLVVDSKFGPLIDNIGHLIEKKYLSSAAESRFNRVNVTTLVFIGVLFTFVM